MGKSEFDETHKSRDEKVLKDDRPHDLSGTTHSQIATNNVDNNESIASSEKPKTQRRRRRWGDKDDLGKEKQVKEIENEEMKTESKVKVHSEVVPNDEKKTSIIVAVKEHVTTVAKPYARRKDTD